jgi:hypothetical protein
MNIMNKEVLGIEGSEEMNELLKEFIKSIQLFFPYHPRCRVTMVHFAIMVDEIGVINYFQEVDNEGESQKNNV